MINLLPKSVIINHIVDTLIKNPEDGITTLIDKITVKTKDDELLLTTIKNYLVDNKAAKMQIKNIVFNTDRNTLKIFTQKIYDSLTTSPVRINFLKIASLNQLVNIRPNQPVFPVIELNNLNTAVVSELANLKKKGIIFFTMINVTAENFDITTSDETMLTLIKNGVRGVFYYSNDLTGDLVALLNEKINKMRHRLPILIFYIRKDPKSNGPLSYFIDESVHDFRFIVKLDVG